MLNVKNIGLATLILLGSIPAYATSTSETVFGEVISVIERTREIIRETPAIERVCTDKDVPVYSRKGQPKSELGSLIIGGIIGSAIGNKMSESQGAGAAGSVAGALIGRETAKKANTENQEIIGYNRTQSCENVRTVSQQTIQEVIGYRIKVNVEGKNIDIDSQTKYLPGSMITVTKTVNYALQ